MKTLTAHILEARDIAAEREPDIRIKEFVRAIHISPRTDGGVPSCAFGRGSRE